MDKNYRQYNKRASMDSIEVPDVDKIKSCQIKVQGQRSEPHRRRDFDGESLTRQGSSTVPQRLTMTLPSTRKRTTKRTISLRTLRLCLRRRRKVLARE